MISRLAAFCVFAVVGLAGFVQAQQEFPPPQGKGRVVVVVSGMSGAGHYEAAARDIAALGYDAVLFDGNPMEGTHGDALKVAIVQAQAMPHALPGKVGLVGFSLGGGLSLYYGTQWPDLVAGAVLWYPATTFIKDVPGWAERLKVPVLMFAGEKDTFRGCCLVGAAHTLADAAKAGGKAFELITYPKTEHDFVKGGGHYNAEVYADAMQRTGARLKELLGE
jgi:dienelactone hydrolase